MTSFNGTWLGMRGIGDSVGVQGDGKDWHDAAGLGLSESSIGGAGVYGHNNNGRGVRGKSPTLRNAGVHGVHTGDTGSLQHRPVQLPRARCAPSELNAADPSWDPFAAACPSHIATPPSSSATAPHVGAHAPGEKKVMESAISSRRTRDNAGAAAPWMWSFVLLALAGTSCTASRPEDVVGEPRGLDVQVGEPCDPEACGLNDWDCDADTHRSTGLSGTSYRKQCESSGDCAPSEMCAVSLQIGALVGMITPICIPKCTNDGRCQTVSGYRLFQNNQSMNCTEQGSCVIACSTDTDCPPGVSCWNGSICAGPFY